MYIDIPKKRLAFRILASMLLLCTIAMLFVPSVLLTTKEEGVGYSNSVSTRYSAVSIIAGAFSSGEEQDILDTRDGKTLVEYMKTKGEEQGICDKKTTYSFAYLILLSVSFAFLGAVVNFLTLLKKCPKFIRVLESLVPFFIFATFACATAAFCISYFWISGSYTANEGINAIRTTLKSYAYLGLMVNVLIPVISYVFYHDRKLKA